LKRTVPPEVNPEPDSVTYVYCPPMISLGEMAVRVGIGLSTGTFSGEDAPPPGIGLETWIDAVPVALSTHG
jgi:hypothetical protein